MVQTKNVRYNLLSEKSLSTIYKYWYSEEDPLWNSEYGLKKVTFFDYKDNQDSDFYGRKTRIIGETFLRISDNHDILDEMMDSLNSFSPNKRCTGFKDHIPYIFDTVGKIIWRGDEYQNIFPFEEGRNTLIWTIIVYKNSNLNWKHYRKNFIDKDGNVFFKDDEIYIGGEDGIKNGMGVCLKKGKLCVKNANGEILFSGTPNDLTVEFLRSEFSSNAIIRIEGYTNGEKYAIYMASDGEKFDVKTYGHDAKYKASNHQEEFLKLMEDSGDIRWMNYYKTKE